MIKKYFIIFFLSSLGGWVFSLVHFPLPWTLGPLATIIVAKIVFKQQVYWPAKIRDSAMIVLGYVMGSPFTPQTGLHIVSQLPAMSMMTLLTVILCLLGGYITGKYLDLHLTTSLLGSMPGGLAQMAIVCEDVEGSDAAAVTLMQTVRILTTVFIVPFLVLHGLADHVTESHAGANTGGKACSAALIVGSFPGGIGHLQLGVGLNIEHTHIAQFLGRFIGRLQVADIERL